jgi:hypothetical protein
MFDQINSMAVALCVIVSIIAVTSVFVSRKIYFEFGWIIFDQQGASIEKRKLLQTFHMLFVGLRIGLFFYLSVGIMYFESLIFYAASLDNCANSNYYVLATAALIISTELYFGNYLSGFLGLNFYSKSAMIYHIGFQIMIIGLFLFFVFTLSSSYYFYGADYFDQEYTSLLIFISISIIISICCIVLSYIILKAIKDGKGI